MDGGLLYEHLTANPANHAYDGVAGIAAGDHAAHRPSRGTRSSPGSSA